VFMATLPHTTAGSPTLKTTGEAGKEKNG